MNSSPPFRMLALVSDPPLDLRSITITNQGGGYRVSVDGGLGELVLEDVTLRAWAQILVLRDRLVELFGADPTVRSTTVFPDGGAEMNGIREALGLPAVDLPTDFSARLIVTQPEGVIPTPAVAVEDLRFDAEITSILLTKIGILRGCLKIAIARGDVEESKKWTECLQIKKEIARRCGVPVPDGD